MVRSRLVAAIVFSTLIALLNGARSRAADEPLRMPLAIWPSGPLEVVAAFDAAVDPASAASLVGKRTPYFEPNETSKDRTEPPRPTGAIRIVGARLTDGAKTLILATEPHPRVARYLFPLSAEAGSGKSTAAEQTGVPYDLSGIEASWREEGDPAGEPGWSGWWPALDSDSARMMTAGSTRHEAGFALLSKLGRLNLSTLIRLPVGSFVIRINATGPIEEASAADVEAESNAGAAEDELYHAELAIQAKGDPLFLTVTARTGQGGRAFSLKVSYRSNNEKTFHPLLRDQLLVPWAPFPAASETVAPLIVPDLAEGNAARGGVLFSSEQLRCSQCHTFRGQGGKVGPDLTDIGRKSRAEIYRSIAAPSAAIEPQYISYTVATKDGQVVVGVVSTPGPDAIQVSDTNARTIEVLRSQIQQIRPSANSVMPVGLAAALGDGAVRDVIAFLTTTPAQTATTRARLLSFDELRDKLAQPDLRLLDVRDHADYSKGHIPGAICVDLKSAQPLASSAQGLTDRAAWERWITPLGIGPSTEVVVYDSQRQLSAARAWWLLSYLGVKNVGLIDGGFPLWAKQGRPVATDLQTVTPRVFRVELQIDRLATRDQVLRSVSDADPIVDARSTAEFTGQEARAKRGGHIPSACHLEWSKLVDSDGRFLDAGAARVQFDSLGIRPGRPIITHCQSGGRASVNAFVLERLGFPARNYYLGWSDWGNAGETPVESGTGKSPQN